MEFREPIQVTYLINTLSIGGAERGMARLLSGLPTDRFEVTVVALATRGGGIVDQLPDRVDVVDLAIESPLDITRLRTVWSELQDTDVLVTSLYHATQIGRVFGTLRRVPVILSWQHSEHLESIFRQRQFSLLSILDTRVLADSESALRGASKYGVNLDKVRRIPIAGIDLKNYSPVTHEPREIIRVGTLGRLTPAKNFQTVLDVADVLQEQPIEFYIGGFGPMRDTLEQYAADKGINNVVFKGLIEDVPQYLNDLDIYFQPSIREGLCITVIEAMAAGLPVVASNVGGISESVIEDETGFLEESSSTDAFAQDILELSTDPDRRSAFGTAGRKRVEKYYSKERLVEGFCSVIDDI